MATQRPLFAGLDCLPGQQDLFPTDGQLPCASDYCAACGELIVLADDDDAPAFVGADNSPFCSAKCLDAGEREIADLAK